MDKIMSNILPRNPEQAEAKIYIKILRKKRFFNLKTLIWSLITVVRLRQF